MFRWRMARSAASSSAPSRAAKMSARLSRWAVTSTPHKRRAPPRRRCAGSGTPTARAWVCSPMELAEIVRRLEVEDLYTEYAACLDSDGLERWPDFFTEDCAYRITSAENHEAGLPLGLIYCSSRKMLADRISALREANIYEPQRYRHLISGIRIEKRENGPLEVSANFLVIRT